MYLFLLHNRIIKSPSWSHLICCMFPQHTYRNYFRVAAYILGLDINLWATFKTCFCLRHPPNSIALALSSKYFLLSLIRLPEACTNVPQKNNQTQILVDYLHLFFVFYFFPLVHVPDSKISTCNIFSKLARCFGFGLRGIKLADSPFINNTRSSATG